MYNTYVKYPDIHFDYMLLPTQKGPGQPRAKTQSSSLNSGHTPRQPAAQRLRRHRRQR